MEKLGLPAGGAAIVLVKRLLSFTSCVKITRICCAMASGAVPKLSVSLVCSYGTCFYILSITQSSRHQHSVSFV